MASTTLTKSDPATSFSVISDTSSSSLKTLMSKSSDPTSSCWEKKIFSCNDGTIHQIMTSLYEQNHSKLTMGNVKLQQLNNQQPQRCVTSFFPSPVKSHSTSDRTLSPVTWKQQVTKLLTETNLLNTKKLDTYIYLYLFCFRGYWYNIISTTSYRSFADLWDMTYETTHWLVLTVQKWSLPSLSKPCKAQFPPMIASGFGMSPSCPNTMALAPSVTYAHIGSREREFEKK